MYFFFFLHLAQRTLRPSQQQLFFSVATGVPVCTFLAAASWTEGGGIKGRTNQSGDNSAPLARLGNRARKTSSSVNPEFGISLRAAKAEPTTNSTPPAHLPRPERRFNCAPAKNPSITNAPAMALSCRYAAQSCARQLRSSSSLRASTTLFQTRTPATARRHNSTEAAAPTNPKIAAIVDQISTLTLLETADLVSSLKVS